MLVWLIGLAVVGVAAWFLLRPETVGAEPVCRSLLAHEVEADVPEGTPHDLMARAVQRVCAASDPSTHLDDARDRALELIRREAAGSR